MMLAPATTVVLIVSPSLNADGRKAYSTRGQLFDGKVDGRFVVKRSTTPFCDAARVLLAEGTQPDTLLVMRHAGSVTDTDALRSTVGVAAGLTVRQGNGRPEFTGYRAPDFRTGAPPMRETDPVATTHLTTAAIEPVSDLQHPRRFVPTATFPSTECLTAPVLCARVDGRNGPHPIPDP